MTQITSGRVKLAEFARSVHVAVAPAGVTLEDALKPEFWNHVAANIRPWDRIELRSEDDSWFADLIVVRATRLEVFAHVVNSVDITKAEKTPGDEAVPPGYQVNFGGPIHKYRVIRSADSEVLAHGMSKADAIAWAKEHAKAA